MQSPAADGLGTLESGRKARGGRGWSERKGSTEETASARRVLRSVMAFIVFSNPSVSPMKQKSPEPAVSKITER